MAPELNWTNEEWRRLQTSLFAVTGSTRIRLSELTPEQWQQVSSVSLFFLGSGSSDVTGSARHAEDQGRHRCCSRRDAEAAGCDAADSSTCRVLTRM
eukprot:756222-Hanusia_phi.AAC.1